MGTISCPHLPNVRNCPECRPNSWQEPRKPKARKIPHDQTALREFNAQVMKRKISDHPDLPYPYVKPYKDGTANELTKSVIAFIQFHGGQAERISTTGRRIDNTKVVQDVLGYHRMIGSVKWIPPSMTRGSADVSATINGRSVKIEVKVGKDYQKPDQVEYQRQVEAAGGVYMIARTFQDFYEQYLRLVNP